IVDCARAGGTKPIERRIRSDESNRVDFTPSSLSLIRLHRHTGASTTWPGPAIQAAGDLQHSSLVRIAARCTNGARSQKNQVEGGCAGVRLTVPRHATLSGVRQLRQLHAELLTTVDFARYECLDMETLSEGRNQLRRRVAPVIPATFVAP